MREWFAVEKIDGDTFAVSEYGHWEETHCYLMCGSEKALLVDTGLGVANIRRVAESLTELPVEAAVTHAHWDHIGGLGLFENTAVHAAEKAWLSAGFPVPLSAVRDSLLRAPCKFPEGFDIDNYEIYQGEPRRILHDGDRFDLGNRQIVVVHTPGHSPGHCCFYEPERGYLCSGDLIYEGCLDAFYPSTDPRLFWQSVRGIQARLIGVTAQRPHDTVVPAAHPRRRGLCRRSFRNRKANAVQKNTQSYYLCAKRKSVFSCHPMCALYHIKSNFAIAF